MRIDEAVRVVGEQAKLSGSHNPISLRRSVSVLRPRGLQQSGTQGHRRAQDLDPLESQYLVQADFAGDRPPALSSHLTRHSRQKASDMSDNLHLAAHTGGRSGAEVLWAAGEAGGASATVSNMLSGQRRFQFRSGGRYTLSLGNFGATPWATSSLLVHPCPATTYLIVFGAKARQRFFGAVPRRRLHRQTH